MSKYYIKVNKRYVKSDYNEFIMVALMMLFSFINTLSLTIAMLIGTAYYLRKKEEGALKILVLVSIRSLIGAQLAVGIGNVQIFKYLILVGVSLYLISRYKQVEYEDWKSIRSIGGILIIFVVYHIIVALLNSSLPLMSIFKIVLFGLCSSSIVIGRAITYKRFNLLEYLYRGLQSVIITSILVIPIKSMYHNYSGLFHGVTNQPNTLGMVIALFITLLLIRYEFQKGKLSNIIINLTMSIILIFLCGSRTSLFASMIVLVIYFIFTNKNNILKVLFIPMSMLGICLLMLYNADFSWLTNFIYKWDSNNIFFSRSEQINNGLSVFIQHPILGSGFRVPNLETRSLQMALTTNVETGNILIAIFMDGGIIGGIIFITLMISVLACNKYYFKTNIILIISVMIINMAEMMFFSPNGLGLFAYFFIGLYIFNYPIKGGQSNDI